MRSVIIGFFTFLAGLMSAPAFACSIAVPNPGWIAAGQPHGPPAGPIYLIVVDETGDSGPLQVTTALLEDESNQSTSLTATTYPVEASGSWPDAVFALVVLDLPEDGTLDSTGRYRLTITTPDETVVDTQIGIDPPAEPSAPVFGDIELEVEEFINWGDSECCIRQLNTCVQSSCDDAAPVCAEEVCAPTAFEYGVGVTAVVEPETRGTPPERYIYSFIAIQDGEEVRTNRVTVPSETEFEVCFAHEVTDVMTGESTRTEATCATQADVTPIERIAAPGLADDACASERDERPEAPDPDSETEEPDTTVDGDLADNGCGCAQGGSDPGALALLLLGFLVRRRTGRRATGRG